MRGTQTILPSSRLAAGIIPAYAGNTYENGCTVVKYRDHPRVCGEHAVQGRRVRLMGGSSPRMRGTPGRSHVSVRMAGIIPAYAGNTCRPLPYSTPSRDHPRVCGEHAFLATDLRVRIGIIPAYAGNTRCDRRGREIMRDHPRVCGEHLRAEIYCSILWGSSPRMRGTRHHRFRRGVGPWIIPAYAGNTRLSSKKGYPSGDHPRVCGEHALFASAKADPLGSSPRMRGTPYRRSSVCLLHGIIPAYAGNTVFHGVLRSVDGDHPRVCGEHIGCGKIYGTTVGSSPRMRGTRLTVKGIFESGGIIPAYAGNTRIVSSRFRRTWDHPRVCGEH